MELINLMIVDDDPKDLETMTAGLDGQGYRIFSASSGGSALSLAEKERLEIVLLNVILPDLDGYSLCKQLRKLYYQKPFQIVLLSALVEEPYLTRCLEVGGDDFIRKPVSALELQVRLRAAVIRLRNQIGLIKEREFFREAVKEEEKFSSKVLDQNMYLKRAFKDMEIVNRELERVNQELEKVAKHDVLSGLLNRLSLFNMVDAEIDRSMRNEIPLCGIMMDIDHFKNVNDNFGHQCGDEVIRHIGRCLRNGLRKYDHAGRYGGEEFFIILPNTSLDQATSIAERFREELEAEKLACDDQVISVTASLGVAQYRSGESKEMWIARADRSMYQAKQRGRNCVAVES